MGELMRTRIMAALTALAGCHHGPYASAEPSPADTVNVGYAKQASERSSGSVRSATTGLLANVKTTRVEELLEGRFPGVHVFRTRSGGFSVRIRGPGTIVGSGEPLYVVDGTPVEVDPVLGLSWLNPADVARIEVLKNPAETSLYGVRGANGVIIITTKRGP
jgi:TonB-dependent SusC/RagA subfamily outer membrane receptor